MVSGSCLVDDLKAHPFWILLVSSLGFLSLINTSTIFLKWIYTTLIRPEKDLKTAYGPWAVVTGSTDGIGRSFAFKLAERGLNLVLISRDEGKLKQVSAEIQRKHPGTEIRVSKVDFSRDDVVSGAKTAVEGLDVGILVNNVGVTYPSAMYFHEVQERVWMDLVKVNAEGTTLVTKAVVPGMVVRGRGAVVCIGSGASAVVPSHPLYAIYAATKAYVDKLARSLHVEYKQRGIDVQCQVPLYVRTGMASRVAAVDKSSAFVPTADEYAAAAVGFIGRERRCTPYYGHAVQWAVASLLPDALLDRWRLSVGIKRRELLLHRA